jgi:hypothetical protein
MTVSVSGSESSLIGSNVTAVVGETMARESGVRLQTCFYLMDYWEKKLRCGHARIRVFAPALGGAVYTCKDLADSLAGKDRYEFENSSKPRLR